MVSYVDLSADRPLIKEQTVSRVFGRFDIYRDTSKPSAEQNQVEEMLSKLESDASRITRKITESFHNGETGTWLTRTDRNLLRKFLFIMKYRGSTFHHRFYHEELASYFADDKERLIKYMQEKNFSRPIDVWLDNMKVILNLDMDVACQWIYDLPKRMYPDDALWFIKHCQTMYMAICVPANDNDEFILTDNSYHIAEGPHRVSVDPSTGQFKQGRWTCFHEFAPLAPRVMIVLRSFYLPSKKEDADPAVKALKNAVWSRMIAPFQSGTTSLLADLPIERARNNYTLVANGQLQLIPGEDGTYKSTHKFHFLFFRIKTIHVNTINGILFDNAIGCNSLVFSSKASFCRTLEWYLTVELQKIGKRTTRASQDPRRIVLLKLSVVLKQLGSDKLAIRGCYSINDQAKIPEFSHELSYLPKMLLQVLSCVSEDNPSEFMKIYKHLGGSKQTLVKDNEQAILMWNLRTKIDVWSQGLPEELRSRNRNLLIDTYLEFPRRRVWVYLKVRKSNVLQNVGDASMNDPEDIIAKCQSIVKRGKLNRQMHNAARNDIEMKSFSEFDSWNNIFAGENKLEAALRLKWQAVQDHIENCGIEVVEKLASYYQPEAQKYHLECPNVELMTRMMVREQFRVNLYGKLETRVLKDLYRIFFGVIYPTPIMPD